MEGSHPGESQLIPYSHVLQSKQSGKPGEPQPGLFRVSGLMRVSANTQDGVGWLLGLVFGCFPAVEVGGEDEVGGGGCPLFFPGVGLGLDVLVEVGWDSDGDAFGGEVLVGDFPVGCGVGCEAFGEKLAEHF